MDPIFRPAPWRKYPRGRIPRGLTHWWPLTAGTIDNVARPHEGTTSIYGALDASVSIGSVPPFVSREPSVRYSGTTSTAPILLNAHPHTGQSTCSIACWFYIEDGIADDSRLVCWDDGAGRTVILTVNVGGTGLSFDASTISGTSGLEWYSGGPVRIPHNGWHHVVAVAYGTTGAGSADIYLDGVSVRSIASPSTDANAGYSSVSGVSAIGARGDGVRQWIGQQRDVMYAKNAAWSASEVADLYASYFVPVEEEWPALRAPSAAASAAFGRLPGLRTIGPRLQTPPPDLRHGLTFWVPFHDFRINPTNCASDLGPFNIAINNVGSSSTQLDPVQYPDGTVGGGVKLDGTVGTSVPLSSGLISVNELNWSMSIWAKAATTPPANSPDTYSGHLFLGDSTQFMGIYRSQIGPGNDVWAAYNWDTGDDKVTTPCTPNVWTHLVATSDSTTLSLYKDGALIGTMASGQTGTRTGVLTLNKTAAPIGSVGDARFYGRTLTAGEVLALYQNPFTAESYRSQETWGGPATAGAVVTPTGRVKVWNGSAWVVKPTKVWSGSAWVTKPTKVWNGSAWV